MESENVGGHEGEKNARFRVKLQRVKILGLSSLSTPRVCSCAHAQKLAQHLSRDGRTRVRSPVAFC